MVECLPSIFKTEFDRNHKKHPKLDDFGKFQVNSGREEWGSMSYCLFSNASCKDIRFILQEQIGVCVCVDLCC